MDWQTLYKRCKDTAKNAGRYLGEGLLYATLVAGAVTSTALQGCGGQREFRSDRVYLDPSNPHTCSVQDRQYCDACNPQQAQQQTPPQSELQQRVEQNTQQSQPK